MLEAVLLIGVIVCALQAARVSRLLIAALWLAAASALLATFLYLLGAHFIAVMELSVGAGLVTVLIVFAVSVIGEEQDRLPALVYKPLAIGLIALMTVVLSWQMLVGAHPHFVSAHPLSDLPFVQMFWQQRALDVLVQLALIFSGVLGMLALLAESKIPVQSPAKAAEQMHREATMTQPPQWPLVEQAKSEAWWWIR